MDIELCSQLIPKVLAMSEIDEIQLKLKSYMTLEVVFSCRRFPNNHVCSNTLKHFLSNSEISTGQTIIDDEENMIKVDAKDENRVVSYLKAFSQVVLNLVTTPFDSSIGITDDQKLKYVAATISIMSEYLFNSTPKIQ